MSNLLYPPKTPPRRTARGSHLQPSSSPFVTPSKARGAGQPRRTPATAASGGLGGGGAVGLFRSCSARAVVGTAGRIHGGVNVETPEQRRCRTASKCPLSSSAQRGGFGHRQYPRSPPRSAPRSASAAGAAASGAGASPSTNAGNDDRFIPSRRHTNLDLCRRALLSDRKRPRSIAALDDGRSSSTPSSTSPPNPVNTAQQETPLQKEFKRRMLSSLCNVPLTKLDEDGEPTGLLAFSSAQSNKIDAVSSTTSTSSRSNQTRSSATSSGYGSSSAYGQGGGPNVLAENPFSHDLLRTMKLGESSGLDAVEDLSVAKKVLRKVPSAPFRILDAPDIVDDYYLNLISWSKDNMLAVALAQSVYLWNATNGEIHHLVTLESPSDYVTSVNWCTLQGYTKYIAVGTNAHSVHLFDSAEMVKVRTLLGHSGRVASIAWNQNWLTSGSRDATILNHDIRAPTSVVAKYRGHQQEVCGLKWNEDGSCLASGGNENFLCLWDAAMSGQQTPSLRRNSNNAGAGRQLSDQAPRLILKKHKAAVKALDWCPFHRGLLASGGGTSDRTIKFWNSSSGAMLNSIDTGSQVCSIIWSKHQRELCSSHGYSENQLILWKYPTMTRIKELPGHTARVLNMEISPDGASVVSAAADETLRFWNVFGSPSAYRRSASGIPLLGDIAFANTPTIR